MTSPHRPLTWRARAFAKTRWRSLPCDDGQICWAVGLIALHFDGDAPDLCYLDFVALGFSSAGDDTTGGPLILLSSPLLSSPF
jgi:hypothetical protein